MERSDPFAGKEYWLANCHGFQVDAPSGRLGVVERVERRSDGSVRALIVLGGVLGATRWEVPVDDVAVVQPRRQRVGLVDGPAAIRLLRPGRRPVLRRAAAAGPS